MYPIHPTAARSRSRRWLPAAGPRRGHRLLRPDRARRRLRPRRDEDPRAGETAATGSSTAPRCGSPTAASPTSPSSGRRPTTASAGSWSRRAWRATRPATSCASTRCAPRSPRNCSSTTSACPRRTCCPGAEGSAAPLSCLTQARYGIAWGVIGAAIGLLRRGPRVRQDAASCSAGRSPTPRPIQRRLADMCRRITTAQLLALQLGRLKDAGHACTTPRSRWPSGTTSAWRSTSRATRATCSAPAASPSSTRAIRHMLNLESVITYEGTETDPRTDRRPRADRQGSVLAGSIPLLLKPRTPIDSFTVEPEHDVGWELSIVTLVSTAGLGRDWSAMRRSRSRSAARLRRRFRSRVGSSCL